MALSSADTQGTPPPVGAAPNSIASLDGLRAIAAGMVMLTHLPAPYFLGGFAGVDVFFVLSGFLITSTLTRGFQTWGRQEFGRFYFRRILRLWPPVALCLLLSAFLWDKGFRPLGVDFAPAALASALNYTNWRNLLLTPDAMGLLSHTWSLSIEEQFYLVWPLGLWLLLSRKRDPLPILCGLIATIWGGRVAVTLSGSHMNLQFNSLTRMDAILLGCALCLSQNRSWFHGPWLSWLQHPMTSLAALLVLAVTLFVQSPSPQYFSVGLPLIALTSAVLIAHGASRRPSLVRRLLEWPPMTFIGRRSYGIYLYHLPIFMTVNSYRNAPTRGNFITFSLACVGLTLIVSCLSFLLEEPLIRWGREWLDGRKRAPAPGSLELGR